jgi:DNA-binding NarL/FixJ family response regulator
MSGGGRFGTDSYLPLAEQLGAKATLQKPFMREDLLETVKSVLAGD